MTGGLIQLVAYGVEDIFLTRDPQITYFKTVYRRHTNFSIEMVPQPFSHKGNFGKKVSATISRAGDLVHRMYLEVKIPRVPQFFNDDGSVDEITKFAWARRIGFALIKSVEIEIGGTIVDRHYGEWMNIWYEVGMKHSRGLSHMIGDVSVLRDFSNGKDAFKLTIPLQFWFCRYPGLALPLVSLQYSEVRVNVEFNELEKCRNITPTHFIRLDDDVVNFTPFEYICQTVGQRTTYGQFIYYDIEEKKLYYDKISGDGFLSISNSNLLDDTQTKEIVRDDANAAYKIIGIQSTTEVMPAINAVERTASTGSMRNLSLRETSILAEYIYLDDDERLRFTQEKHEYLIEQVQYSGQKTIDTSYRDVRLGFQHPCKELFWVLQKDSNSKRNDHFNYTDSYGWDEDGTPMGNNMVKTATIFMNGLPRDMEQSGDYYNWIQSYQHHTMAPMEGINCYSFGLLPEEHQPSGACNMSKIDNCSVQFTTIPEVNFNNVARFRAYAINYNVLRIAHGLSGLVFIDL